MKEARLTGWVEPTSFVRWMSITSGWRVLRITEVIEVG